MFANSSHIIRVTIYLSLEKWIFSTYKPQKEDKSVKMDIKQDNIQIITVLLNKILS
jgi:hypothetical protein